MRRKRTLPRLIIHLAVLVVVDLLRVSIRESSVTATPTPVMPDSETEHVVRVIGARGLPPGPPILR